MELFISTRLKIMATAVNEAELSDVEWLVMRARSFPKSDPYTPKAWLITAKSLFPQSFIIQFESYLVEKSAKNVDEAARHLQDMLQNFPQEPRLWAEVHSILESLQREPQDLKVTFLTELFAAIPTSIQCLMLLRVSETIANVLERCQLLLLAMKKFPNLVQEHGLKLVDMLVKEETNSGIVNNPVNCYRKLLVCDVMPLVLHKSGHLEVNMFQLCLWLQRAIEFYVSYVSQSNDSGGETEGGNVSSKPHGTSADTDLQVSDPWGNLLKLLLLIGQRLNWDIERDLIEKPKQYQIQSLLNQLVRAGPSNLEANSKQVLLTAMVLFVFSLVNYIGYVDTQASTAVGSSHLVPIVLLESLVFYKDGKIPKHCPKKPKVDSVQTPVIHHSSAITSFSNILQLFETAVKCHELLNSTESLRFDFFNLCQNWKEETSNMMRYFQVDMSIYKGKYQDAIELLQSLCPTAQGKLKTRISIQLASCFVCLKQFNKACETVMDMVTAIQSTSISPPTSTSDEPSDEKTSNTNRSLIMLPCCEADIFPFSLQLLISALQKKLMSPERTDSCLAYLIILIQYDWPKQDTLFSEVISVIQKQGSFTYNNFFSYIHEVDILEEFAFLDTPDQGKVSLDIMPTSTKTIAQQRTVTRGVNKGVKEDFKAALERQVGCIKESNFDLIRKFLRDEREELLKCLS